MNLTCDYVDDKFHDECGVFGIFGHPEAAKMVYLGLYALQHRGQESAGIAASDGSDVRLIKSMGHAVDIFPRQAGAASRGYRHRPYPLFHGRRHLAGERPARGD